MFFFLRGEMEQELKTFLMLQPAKKWLNGSFKLHHSVTIFKSHLVSLSRISRPLMIN